MGSVSVTTGHTYTHEIKRNKYGHLQYCSWGYKVNWKRYRSVGNGCGAPHEIGHGTATLPTKETGWKYWETRHDLSEATDGPARRMRCGGVGVPAHLVHDVRQR